jgi:hypothetical protein
MTYDGWKTTNPDDRQLLTLPEDELPEDEMEALCAELRETQAEAAHYRELMAGLYTIIKAMAGATKDQDLARAIRVQTPYRQAAEILGDHDF